MAKSTSLTATYEALPKIAKLIIQFFLGALVGGIYRIVRFVEKGNIVTLIAGIVALIPGPDVVAWIVDFVTELLSNRITVLAD